MHRAGRHVGKHPHLPEGDRPAEEGARAGRRQAAPAGGAAPIGRVVKKHLCFWAAYCAVSESSSPIHMLEEDRLAEEGASAGRAAS